MAESISHRLRKRIGAAASKMAEKLTNPFTTKQAEPEIQIGSPDVSTFIHHTVLRRHAAVGDIFQLTLENAPASSENSDEEERYQNIPRRFSEPTNTPNLRTQVINQNHLILSLRHALATSQQENSTLSNQAALLQLQLERSAEIVTTNTVLRREISQLKTKLGKSKKTLRAELDEQTGYVRRLTRSKEQIDRKLTDVKERYATLVVVVQLFVVGVWAGRERQWHGEQAAGMRDHRADAPLRPDANGGAYEME
ncbi:hypothetical protein Q7P37_011181 [Cladosporium fusiforme]